MENTCDICHAMYSDDLFLRINAFRCSCVNKICARCITTMCTTVRATKIHDIIDIEITDNDLKCPFCRRRMPQIFQQLYNTKNNPLYKLVLDHKVCVEIGEKEEAEKLQKIIDEEMDVIPVSGE